MQPDVAAILKGLLDSMGAEYKDISEIELAGQSIFMISAEDGKKLIGSHGDTIHAIDPAKLQLSPDIERLNYYFEACGSTRFALRFVREI